MVSKDENAGHITALDFYGLRIADTPPPVLE